MMTKHVLKGMHVHNTLWKGCGLGGYWAQNLYQ